MLTSTTYPTLHWKAPFLLLIFILLCANTAPGDAQATFHRPTGLEKEAIPNAYALIFAVQEYKDDKIPGLRSPIQEAEAIAKVLREKYGFGVEVYRNPEKQVILDALLEWQKRRYDKNSHLFIFFTGHGIFREEFKTGYFIPWDGKRDDPYHDSYIGLPIIRNAVAIIPCDHILLAIDACYSGTIDPDVAFKNMNMKPVPKTLDSIGIPKSLPSRTDILELLKGPPIQSRLVITSGLKEETPDPSPFSKAILTALQNEYPKPHKDSTLTYHQLLTFLDDVNPVPYEGELRGHEEGGSFVFWGKGKGSPPPISVPTKPMADGRTWTTQNLNYKTPGSFCYDDNPENCRQYGRLYTWEAAKKACKSLGKEWRLPTMDEWETLVNAYSYSDFVNGGSSGFDAQPGGWRTASGGDFTEIGKYGFYWSSSGRYSPPGRAKSLKIKAYKSRGLAKFDHLTSSALSCRCILKE